jgi:hypothetical protein
VTERDDHLLETASPLQTEWELEEKVRLARREYESAVEEARRLVEQTQELGLSHPDGIYAIRNATRLQKTASQQYSEAVKELCEFVLGKDTPSKCA